MSTGRDHALGDVLGCAYILLRMHYLEHCGNLFSGGTTWQDKELALYAVRCVQVNVSHFHSLGSGLYCRFVERKNLLRSLPGNDLPGTLDSQAGSNDAHTACRIVSGAVKVRSLQSEPIQDSATQQDAANTSSFLSTLFASICTGAAGSQVGLTF